MPSLLAELGSVCQGCAAFNDAGVLTCGTCGSAIEVAGWVHGVPAPVAAPAPVPAEAPRPKYDGFAAARAAEEKAKKINAEKAAAKAAAAAAAAPAAKAPAAPLPAPRAAPPAAAPQRSAPITSTEEPLPLTRPKAEPVPLTRPKDPTTSGSVPAAAPLPPPPVAPPAARRVCPKCATSLAGSPLFCPSCGARLADEATIAARRATTGAGPQVPGTLAPGKVKLVLLRGAGQEGMQFRLSAESTQAGRSKGAVVFPTDETLAPHSATFHFRNGRLYLKDELGPSGSYVRIRAPEVLRPGDVFAIGDKLLRFPGKVPPPQKDPGGTVPHGSTRPPGSALIRLEILHLGGAAGRGYVRAAPFRIGRAMGEILFTDDPFISARHCELDVDAEGAILRDLGSSNGSFVRIPAGSERELREGDYVRLGRNILRVDPA